MLVIFANNQTMVAPPGGVATIQTDPIPLNGNDRFDGIVLVHTIFNVAAPGLRWSLEVSNDGVTFVPFGAVGDTVVAGAVAWIIPGVAFAFARVVFTLTAGAGVVGGATFDCNVNVDKQG